MKTLLKNIALFLLFGAIYFGIECAWKGQLSHWSMFIVGGLVGVFIGGINEHIPWEMPFWKQCTLGMFIATIFEAISGLILNVGLGLNVWHYEKLAFCWGQCSLPFMIVWFVLAGVCIMLDDYARWKWFGEDYPIYF